MTARREIADVSERGVPRSLEIASIAFIVVVFAALVANILVARMTRSEINNMPFVFSAAYDWGGRFGVTLAVIAIGLSVILLGLIGERLATWTGRLIHGPATIGEMCDFDSRSGSSMMRLESAKYLSGYRSPEPPPECERESRAENEASVPELILIPNPSRLIGMNQTVRASGCPMEGGHTER